MATITEDYVSFETAKLLWEKGFDWMESPFYSEQDMNEWKCHNIYTVPNPLYNPDLPFDSEIITLRAPHVSFQLAMKWLRKVHNLHIMVDCIGAENYIPTIQFTRNSKDIEINSKISKIGGNGFDSHEEACEAAIKYCLENLI